MPHDMLFKRIRAEYLEMPGLRLTLDQAHRLCGVERALCQAILEGLVEAKFLCKKPDGAYARLCDGEIRSSVSIREQHRYAGVVHTSRAG
jgi:hypothetical protein